MHKATRADVALVNSGCLRSDKIHPKGDFKVADLLDLLPYYPTIVVVRISGKTRLVLPITLYIPIMHIIEYSQFDVIIL